jgi:hypothetical protein
LIRDKLLATYREFWPLDINGSDPQTKISLWHEDNPFYQYAADVERPPAVAGMSG